MGEYFWICYIINGQITSFIFQYFNMLSEGRMIQRRRNNKRSALSFNQI
jgi:hypothetical protein